MDICNILFAEHRATGVERSRNTHGELRGFVSGGVSVCTPSQEPTTMHEKVGAEPQKDLQPPTTRDDPGFAGSLHARFTSGTRWLRGFNLIPTVGASVRD